MVVVTAEGQRFEIEAGREAFLRSLHQKASGGDQSALAELSSIASGRNDLPLARKLVRDLDEKTPMRVEQK